MRPDVIYDLLTDPVIGLAWTEARGAERSRTRPTTRTCPSDWPRCSSPRSSSPPSSPSSSAPISTSGPSGWPEEGTSFQAVLNTTRESLARRHLVNGAFTAGEIAFLLGYEEPSSFSALRPVVEPRPIRSFAATPDEPSAVEPAWKPTRRPPCWPFWPRPRASGPEPWTSLHSIGDTSPGVVRLLARELTRRLEVELTTPAPLTDTTARRALAAEADRRGWGLEPRYLLDARGNKTF